MSVRKEMSCQCVKRCHVSA